MTDRQWFHDDEFDTPLPEWLADEVTTCYGRDELAVNFAQGLAAFLNSRDLTVRRNPSTDAEDLNDMELLAWVGADEFDGSRGIKTAMTPVGWIPLAFKGEHEDRAHKIREQLQEIANGYGSSMHLARFRFSEVLESVTPQRVGAFRATCPICRQVWDVTPDDDCMWPACGHYGDRTVQEDGTVHTCCEKCGLEHAWTCELMPGRS